jgi:hypothetical protein
VNVASAVIRARESVGLMLEVQFEMAALPDNEQGGHWTLSD